MVDLKTETILSLNQATKHLALGRSGRPTHISTLIRAIMKGELEALRQGSRWITSLEALQRWCERQTAVALTKGPSASVPTRTSESRTRSAERASRELDRIGV